MHRLPTVYIVFSRCCMSLSVQLRLRVCSNKLCVSPCVTVCVGSVCQHASTEYTAVYVCLLCCNAGLVSQRIVVVSAILVMRKHVLELLHTVNKVSSYAAAVTSVQQCQRACQHAYTGCRRSKMALRKANTVVVCAKLMKSKTRKLKKQEQELSVCFHQVINSVERMSACHLSSIGEHNVIMQGKTLLVRVKSKTRKLKKARAGAVCMLPLGCQQCGKDVNTSFQQHWRV